ncbi:tetratricopeptide repeat protein [Planctomycetaceae bacterium SH139]
MGTVNPQRQRFATWRPGIAWLVVSLALWSSGCRAIRQHVDSRQSIAARKVSRLGLEAMHEQRWSEAERQFNAALELNQADDRAHWGLSEALWQRGERGEAITHMEQAVRLSGSDPQLVVRLGRMYLEVGRIDDAAEKSQESLHGGREFAATWALQGDVMSALGQDSQALAAYHRALVLEANSPEVHVAIAELYNRQGRYDRLLATLDCLEENVELNACPIRVQYLRGLAMHEMGRPREAVACFEAVVEHNPHDPQALVMLAQSQLETGNMAGARQAIERALQLDANSPAARAVVAHMQQLEMPLAR